MTQPSLFDYTPKQKLRFAGSDYVPSRDDVRLTGQSQRIFSLMRDGKQRTLREIAAATGDPEASVSAQLRFFRQTRFGAHTVEKTHVGDGVYFYKLTVNPNIQMKLEV